MKLDNLEQHYRWHKIQDRLEALRYSPVKYWKYSALIISMLVLSDEMVRTHATRIKRGTHKLT